MTEQVGAAVDRIIEDNEVSFDHHTDAYARDPHSIYKDLRAGCPVASSPSHGGFWIVSRYEDVIDVTRRPELFSSRVSSIPAETGFGDVRVPPLQLDPPDHARFKRLLALWFAPARIADMEPRVRQNVVSLIEPLVGLSTCDASSSFARMVPAKTMSDILGVAPDQEDQFFMWIRRMLENLATDPEDAASAAMEFVLFFSQLIAERKASPRDDLVSSLLELESEGEQLSEMEITLATLELLGAGIDTVWSTLTSSLLYLARNQHDQQVLRDNPDLLPTAREEFLRAFSPVTVGRTVTEDVEFQGVRMCSGDRVLASFISANRDEAEFERADEVVLDREPNRHIAFGAGIHRCVGSNLARLELQVALDEFLKRLPPFRVADEDGIVWSKGMLWGPRTLPLRFE